MKYRILQQLLSLMTCLLLLTAIAINRNHKLLGYDLNEISESYQPTEQLSKNGIKIISTHELANDVMGYGGKTPLHLYIKNDTIIKIDFAQNSETSEFFSDIENSPSITGLIGLSVEKALQTPIDVVSGATMSSKAVIENINRGLNYAQKTNVKQIKNYQNISFKTICAIIIILSGTIIPVFFNGARFRIYQLILNVIVLGFWSGSFISYSLMVNFLSNGINILGSIVPVFLLTIAFILPLFTKRGHYCGWICPLGSLQEVAGHCIKKKKKISPRLLTILNHFRNILWALLIIIMFCGVTFNWMEYELFTAFMFKQASTIIIVITIIFVILSCFVSRPYCRFVCPTGNLFNIFLKNK